MLEIRRKVFKEIWFSNEIKHNVFFPPIIYKQYSGKKIKKLGWSAKNYYTSLINLKETIEEIYEKFYKNTKYEIRRAEKENITCSIETDLELFRKYFNEEVVNLKISKITKERIDSFRENLIITKAEYCGKGLIYHGYLKAGNRIRLLYSVRLENCNFPNKIFGFANRKLHFEDIKLFKKMGFEIYDFGGISKDEDSKLKNINKFKEEFGGKEVKEINYSNIGMRILEIIRKIRR